ncbi:MAG: SUMF1/EgtB/PvdO family nonheme iron enzyme [Saprospiraceae bacterium]
MKTFCCFFTLLLLSAIAFHPFAQSPLRTGSDYAVFFYVTSFQYGWDKLPETEAETKAIANELESNYGFKVELVPNPTKQQVFDKIVEVNKRKYGPDDQVLFFFSTHGHFNKDTDRGYLVLADGRLYDQYGTSWLSYDDLGSYITASPCRHVMLALDACYSGSFGDRWKGPPDELPWDGTDCKGLAKNALTYVSRIYFTSGNREQRTPAKSRFAKQWLAALREGTEKGVLRKKNIRSYLDDVDYPEPEGGFFSSKHEAGGDFVFVHKNACSIGLQSRTDDRDGDKFVDKMDECPDDYGTVNGCPDTDKDGIPNKDDLCPYEPGTADQNGCPKTKPIRCEYCPEMILVKGGSFKMGSLDGTVDETPIHSVKVNDFYLGKFEVTQAEWNSIMGSNPSYFKSCSQCPVEQVTWYAAKEFITKLNGKTGENFRLPTEAEWEFAARGGNLSNNYTYSGGNNIDEVAWYTGNSGNKTHPVGNKKPNELGLYDMTGNVWEWCQDVWHDSYSGAPSDGSAWTLDGNQSLRVPRGGSWIDFVPTWLRVSDRHGSKPEGLYYNVGFRLARAAR